MVSTIALKTHTKEDDQVEDDETEKDGKNDQQDATIGKTYQKLA